MAKNKKHQRRIENRAGQAELSRDEVMDKLKGEILEECRQVASGAKVSIYEMIEMTKELMVLEADETNERAAEIAQEL